MWISLCFFTYIIHGIMQYKKLITIIALIVFMYLPVMGQTDRDYIINCIREKGECHNVAITQTGGNAMLYGRNGWCAKDCPADFINKLQELQEKGIQIKDFQITENGNWFILWGNNGVSGNDIPQRLEEKIRYNGQIDNVIYSISLNDEGDWAVITENYYSASSNEFLRFLKNGEDNHGKLLTVCVTDVALVAVYENGCEFFGEVPEDLKDTIANAPF